MKLIFSNLLKKGLISYTHFLYKKNYSKGKRWVSHIINPMQLTNKINDDVVEVGKGSDNRNNNYNNDNNMIDIPPSDYQDRQQI